MWRRKRVGAPEIREEFEERLERRKPVCVLKQLPAKKKPARRWKAAARMIDRKCPNGLMFDIGRGSTELIWLENAGRHPHMLDSMSIPHGVVSLSERYGEDAICQEPYGEIVDEMEERLKTFCRRHRGRRRRSSR